jgi:flagellar motor switch protein FliN/FliY
MTSSGTPDFKRLSDIWAESFVQALSQLGIADVAATPVYLADSTVPAEPAENSVSVFFKGGGALRGCFSWRAEKSAALQLAQIFLSESADPANEFAEKYNEAFTRFVCQVADHSASALKRIVDPAMDIVFQPESAAEMRPLPVMTLQIKSEKMPAVSLEFFVDEALRNSFLAAVTETEDSTERRQLDPPLASNLGLLLDVELEATIRFGAREMLLREIFGLVPGAVVELKQMVNEPAELLVAGRLVARGEVVVVEGNFGLRVTEVASRGQRAALVQA